MQFCPECSSMMHAEGEVMICSSCGYEQPREEDLAAEFVSTQKQDESDVIETEEGTSFEGKPRTETTCPECGHGQAWYTIKQTASADEPPTRFFKCVDCGARWREYA
ncbi:MAG: transcription factor S [Halodesulfurarchaeum sp.]